MTARKGDKAMTFLIPQEVVETAETSYAEAMMRMGFSYKTMEAAIQAALATWVEIGKAQLGSAWLSPEIPEAGLTVSTNEYAMRRLEFPETGCFRVLIIRPEGEAS